jgi:Fe2+ transport system protein B
LFCLSFVVWSLYCLSFSHCIVCLSSIDDFWLSLWNHQIFLNLKYKDQKKDNTKTKKQTIQRTKDRQYKEQKTDNTMTKRQTIQWLKDRQYNDQKTDNTMTKRQTIQWLKDRQYIDQKTDNTMTKRLFGFCIFCFFFFFLSVF